MRNIHLNESILTAIKKIGDYGYIDTCMFNKLINEPNNNTTKFKRAQLLKHDYIDAVPMTQELIDPLTEYRSRRAFKLSSKGSIVYYDLTGYRPKLGDKGATEVPRTMTHQIYLSHVVEALIEAYKNYSPIILNERVSYDEQTKIRPDICLLLELPNNRKKRIAFLIEFENSRRALDGIISKSRRYCDFESHYLSNELMMSYDVALVRCVYIAGNKTIYNELLNNLEQCHIKFSTLNMQTLVTSYETIINNMIQNDLELSNIFCDPITKNMYHLLEKMKKQED